MLVLSIFTQTEENNNFSHSSMPLPLLNVQHNHEWKKRPLPYRASWKTTLVCYFRNKSIRNKFSLEWVCFFIHVELGKWVVEPQQENDRKKCFIRTSQKILKTNHRVNWHWLVGTKWTWRNTDAKIIKKGENSFCQSILPKLLIDIEEFEKIRSRASGFTSVFRFAAKSASDFSNPFTDQP